MSIFVLPGRDNITREEHFGIKGFMLTASVPWRDALSVRGLWAPPYASSDFILEVRLQGEKVPTTDYHWDGNSCQREGRLGDLEVKSVLVTPMEQRALLLEIAITNTAPATVTIPVQFAIRGAVDEVSFWEFAGPGNSEREMPWADRALAWVDEGEMVVKRREDRALAVATDLPMDRWETLCGHWEGTLTLQPGEGRTVLVAATIGPAETAVSECRTLLSEGHHAVVVAEEEFARHAEAIFDRLPRLEASDPSLTAFYNRSLVGLLLNQWRVPDFVISPYYSTGGINGGCVCCYLWDFGEPWEILPLHDPESLKSHVKQFLSLDITHHFAWVPTTGEAFGPWYPVNQEKIIFLVYYYVLLTGDIDFLSDVVADKTIMEWMLYHATYRDNQQLPVSLIDYGKGNNHLELRGNFRYDHHLPDLNLRRCANMMAAYELSRLAGEPAEQLPQRAEDLAAIIKQEMWSPEHRWFHHLDENFAAALSYNVQMFKPLGAAALDEEEVQGLLTHLNEQEFLSQWGLHSMSKLDPSYDQVDIDNGGGGNYTAFTPQVIERLYKIRQPKLSEDILQRILWWGARMPYWGDSIVANQIDYRQDTPLQNTIGA
ncbi:MAG: MGH1-like glycoside hydrolase domain-containing protein, partial [Bacteroidota bacterium]